MSCPPAAIPLITTTSIRLSFFWVDMAAYLAFFTYQKVAEGQRHALFIFFLNQQIVFIFCTAWTLFAPRFPKPYFAIALFHKCPKIWFYMFALFHKCPKMSFFMSTLFYKCPKMWFYMIAPIMVCPHFFAQFLLLRNLIFSVMVCPKAYETGACKAKSVSLTEASKTKSYNKYKGFPNFVDGTP